MQTLDQLQKGDKAIIKAINATDELKHRLISFGLFKNSQIEIKECAIRKKTLEIAIGRTLIALRIDEAKKIEVQKSE